MASGLRDHYQPIGLMENSVVEQIAVEMLLSARLLGHEHHIFEDYAQPFERRLVDTIMRVKSANYRRLAQEIEQLERLQKSRRAKSRQDLSGHAEVESPPDEEHEKEEQSENEDQLQVGSDIALSGDCGTNPTPTRSSGDRE
jgi:hypothetical protein